MMRVIWYVDVTEMKYYEIRVRKSVWRSFVKIVLVFFNKFWERKRFYLFLLIRESENEKRFLKIIGGVLYGFFKIKLEK